MRFDRRSLGRAALVLAVVVGFHALWLALGLPGGRAVSDGLFVGVSGLGAWRAVCAIHRLHGRARLCWSAFAATSACWCMGNVAWTWYEFVGTKPVPPFAVSDVFFLGAFVGALVGVSGALLRLVSSRSGVWRVVFDVLTAGGALLLTAWILVFGRGLGPEVIEFGGGVTWLYPALDITVAALTFSAMTHVQPKARPPWLLISAGFLVLAMADTGWAYANFHSGFVTGSLVDPLWVLGYGLVGLAGAVVVGEAGLDTARSRPSQWETVSVYVPLGLFLPVIGWQDLHGGISSSMGLGGTLLGCVLVVRQLLVVAENNRLASTLEARVDQRTAELRSREAHFRSIVTSISDVVLVLDTESHTMSYQTPAVHVQCYEAGELVGEQLDELVHPDDLERHSATFHAREETIGQVYLSRMRHRDGTWRYMEARVTELLDHPDMRGLLIVLRDVGDRVVLEERLRHQAYHDALTGLANRSLLVEELDSALERGEQPSLIVLDLDEFKAVNDTAGHDLGDEVLVAVARRLKHATRPGDLVARLGGDEFAVLVPDDPDALGAMAIAERALRALRLPLTVKQRSIRCLGSVGVAVATVGSSAARLLRDADVAMYVAKAGGKGRVERFTPRMRAELLRRQALEDLVRHAVVDRRLVLHFQPVVDLESGAPVGAEALLRLRDGEGGLVSPVEFVPIAEELGLIGEIGECVLYEACRAAAGWQLPGRPITVAVNVSTRQLRDGHLVGQVATALEQSGLEPELLTLEITEGALGADVDVEATLRSLRVLGVRLSIDDFGAGYSSLGRLRSFPVDELKIDRSFVAELADADDAPLVDAILAMARSLDLRVVAEGIETCGQAASMRERGCTSGQGYLFSPPVPRDEIDALFADRFADLVHARASALAPPTAATASSATTN